ncbi:response regulator [Leifsonia sp. NPDC058230]|uniref:response regulator n=1 Tax=Leifsonia sp. NPDC058230 TaxID=3346391 RepID=UPI0036DBABD2
MSGEWVRRVLVVEDHALMRSLIADALRGRGFEVEARENAAGALSVLDAFDPDGLVTDIDLGERPNGVDLATIVRSRAPHVAVVFLSNLSRAAALGQGREVVASASFVNKGAIESIDQLVDAVEASLDSRPVKHELPPGDARLAMLALSATQLDTVRHLAAGASNAEIARRRGVSVRAVEKSVERIFAALGLSSSEAVTPRVAAASLYITTFGDPASGLGA